MCIDKVLGKTMWLFILNILEEIIDIIILR